MRYWIKLYTEILSDPKMGRLTDRQFRTCINLFAAAGLHDKDGALPPVADIAWQLRCSEDDIAQDMEALARVGIVEQNGDGWHIRKWQERQAKPPSDAPERVAERVQKHRETKRSELATRNEGVTPLQSQGNEGVTLKEKKRIDTDTDKKNDDNAGATDGGQKFSAGIAGAVRAFENAIGMIANGEQAQEIGDVLEELEDKHLLHWWATALKIACDNNARSWSYVRAIITNSLATGKAPGTDKPKRTNGRSNGHTPTEVLKPYEATDAPPIGTRQSEPTPAEIDAAKANAAKQTQDLGRLSIQRVSEMRRRLADSMTQGKGANGLPLTPLARIEAEAMLAAYDTDLARREGVTA